MTLILLWLCGNANELIWESIIGVNMVLQVFFFKCGVWLELISGRVRRLSDGSY